MSTVVSSLNVPAQSPGLRPYLMILRNSLMASVTYRAHIIFMTLGNVFYIIVSYFLWKAIYGAQPNLNGLSFAQAFLQITIAMGIFGLLQTWTEWFMSFQITNGDVVRYLTKPVDYQFSTLFDALGATVSNFFGIAIPTIILAFALAGAPIPSIDRILLFLAALAVGFFLNFCIDFLVGLVSFVTTSIWGFSATKEMIVLFCSGALIPLAFFPEGARAVLEWLPFQAIYYTPVTLLLDANLPPQAILWLFAKQLVWLGILFGLTRLVYKALVKRMVINGG